MCAAPVGAAATTTEQSASILIFPKVVFDGSRDTRHPDQQHLNSMVHAACFYVNAAPLCIGAGDCLAGTCTGTCRAAVGRGRLRHLADQTAADALVSGQRTHADPVAQPCNFDQANYDCDGAGLSFPGRVPPVTPIPFVGELRCIEVDQSGAPISGNHLKGEATIVSGDGDASKYNAVGLLGEPFTNNGDDILCLGGGVTDECPSGAEYEGCGDELDPRPLCRGGRQSHVRTDVAGRHRADAGPLPRRLRASDAEPFTVQFLAFNEFEQRFSASTSDRLLAQLLPRRHRQHLSIC